MKSVRQGDMHRGTTSRRMLAAAMWLVACLMLPRPAAADQSREAFFESRIRPLLVKHCLDCHSADEAEGGLSLESRAGWQRGGDTGPAIALDANGRGRPADSLLFKAVSYADRRIQMPPDGRLAQREIDDLEAWIEAGAFDPRDEAAAAAHEAGPAARYDDLLASHWSYRPLAPPEAGATIDVLVDRRLREEGLASAGEARPETLVRRLWFDLTGLPPTPQELVDGARLVADGGYERLVDQLLASPRHAEHFARHWLDVARYAESVTLRGFLIPQAWRYRDYVVAAFAADMPFDQFIREQIAGDLVAAESPEEERRLRIASSFLALGNHNREEQDKKLLDLDVVDEQLNTIGQAFLGQTIGCARCHDHKFDPLTTREYYALAGLVGNSTLFKHDNVSEPRLRPLPLVGDEVAIFTALEAELAAITAEVDDLSRRTKRQAGKTVSSIPLAAVDGIVVDDAAAARVGEWRASVHSVPYLGDGYLHDGGEKPGSKTLTFTPTFPKPGRYDVYLAYQPAAGRASNAAVSLLHAEGEFEVRVDQRVKPAVGGVLHPLGTFRFEEGDQHYLILSNDAADGHVIADAVVFVETGRPPLRTEEADDEETKAVAKTLEERTKAQKRKQAELASRPRYPGVEETATPRDFPVHVRGNAHVTAGTVPRGLPRLGMTAGGPRPVIPAAESGRRQLADWIASPENTLTARVMANRIWLWLCGAGLVRTPDNFGTTGEPPTHPELLDHLAQRFITGGWSVRRLVREIVLSRTYRQSSQPSPELRRIDPDNRLWSHAFRKRLAAEQLRDAVLATSGRLSFERPPQPTVNNDFGYVHEAPCRSLYVPAFRNSLPDLFTVFDAPDAGSPVGQRNASVIPTQGLFLLNSAFITREAEQIGAEYAAAGEQELGERIVALYRRLVGRSPRPDELAFARRHLAPQADARGWALLTHALLASPDFRYLD